MVGTAQAKPGLARYGLTKIWVIQKLLPARATPTPARANLPANMMSRCVGLARSC